MNMPATARTRSWTPERRQQAAARIRARKPWLASTGPKTAAGKSVSKMNAYKHGARSAAAIERHRALIRFLREQKECLRQIRMLLRLRRQIKKSSIMTNEVIRVRSSSQQHPGESRDPRNSFPKEWIPVYTGMLKKEIDTSEVMRACRQLKSFVPKMLVFENRSAAYI